MDAQHRNRTIMRAVVAIFNHGDLSTVRDLFSPAYIDHQKPADLDLDGPEEFVAIVQGARAASRESLTVKIEDMIADEHAVTARLRWSGIDTNGRHIERETIDILRIHEDQIVEHWGAEAWRNTT